LVTQRRRSWLPISCRRAGRTTGPIGVSRSGRFILVFPAEPKYFDLSRGDFSKSDNVSGTCLTVTCVIAVLGDMPFQAGHDAVFEPLHFLSLVRDRASRQVQGGDQIIGRAVAIQPGTDGAPIDIIGPKRQ